MNSVGQQQQGSLFILILNYTRANEKENKEVEEMEDVRTDEEENEKVEGIANVKTDEKNEEAEEVENLETDRQ